MKSSITQEFQIDCFVEADINVTEDRRVEECHGFHTFYDVDFDIEKIKVYIEIGKKQFDITDRLTKEELRAIEDSLEPTLDID